MNEIVEGSDYLVLGLAVFIIVLAIGAVIKWRKR